MLLRESQRVNQEALKTGFILQLDRPADLDQTNEAVVRVCFRMLDVDAYPFGLAEREHRYEPVKRLFRVDKDNILVLAEGLGDAVQVSLPPRKYSIIVPPVVPRSAPDAIQIAHHCFSGLLSPAVC